MKPNSGFIKFISSPNITPFSVSQKFPVIASKINSETIPHTVRIIQIQGKLFSQNIWKTGLPSGYSHSATCSVWIRSMYNVLCSGIMSINTDIAYCDIYVVICTDNDFSSVTNCTRSCGKVQ